MATGTILTAGDGDSPVMIIIQCGYYWHSFELIGIVAVLEAVVLRPARRAAGECVSSARTSRTGRC